MLGRLQDTNCLRSESEGVRGVCPCMVTTCHEAYKLDALFL